MCRAPHTAVNRKSLGAPHLAMKPRPWRPCPPLLRQPWQTRAKNRRQTRPRSEGEWPTARTRPRARGGKTGCGAPPCVSWQRRALTWHRLAPNRVGLEGGWPVGRGSALLRCRGSALLPWKLPAVECLGSAGAATACRRDGLPAAQSAALQSHPTLLNNPPLLSFPSRPVQRRPRRWGRVFAARPSGEA